MRLGSGMAQGGGSWLCIPPTPCSQPQNSLPDELWCFLFHLPKGTRCLVVFLHREIKAVKEEVN